MPPPFRRVPRAIWLATGGLALAGVLLLATAPPDQPPPAAPSVVVQPPPPVPAPAAAQPTTAGLSLVGILPGGIVVSDGGAQRRVGLGREVRPGLILVRTEGGRAILRSGPDETVLALPSTSLATTTPAAPPPAGPLPAPGADTSAIDSAVALALSPERDARGDLTGWRVRTPPPILAAAGVRAGDILVTVNGRALLSPADIAGIGREAAVSETLVLGLNRDGKPLELRLER